MGCYPLLVFYVKTNMSQTRKVIKYTLLQTDIAINYSHNYERMTGEPVKLGAYQYLSL